MHARPPLSMIIVFIFPVCELFVGRYISGLSVGLFSILAIIDTIADGKTKTLVLYADAFAQAALADPTLNTNRPTGGRLPNGTPRKVSKPI